MIIKLNGDSKSLTAEKTTISELLVLNNVKQPDMVTVQLNGAFVPKEQFAVTLLHQNDEVDFLYFMGGGQ